MDAETFDRWARGLNARLARRGFGRAIAAGVAALGLTGEVQAKKKKKKKKTGCTSPNVACGTACCPPDQPCVNGRCGCAEGEVYCDVGNAAGCIRGNCCPAGACAGTTCCPADTACVFINDEGFVCRCITRDDCAGRCCPTGKACYSGVCEACRPGEEGIHYCGPRCVCVTSVENAAACVDGTTVLGCHDCETDAACTALVEQPALCIARTHTESCPNGRTCIAASYPEQ